MSGVLLAAGLVGCQSDPWLDTAPRSPFERYATLRGHARPLRTTDALGNEVPALRERLRPLDQP